MRPTEPEIPDKRYFRIGEVSSLAGIETYVLRYWETEFPQIKPTRSQSGQRLYSRNDIELVLEIKNLLHEKRFTIEGARQHLKTRQGIPSHREKNTGALTMEQLRDELTAIRDLLSDS